MFLMLKKAKNLISLKIHLKQKASALALSLIFVFVGTLITVSYLEYLQVASRQTSSGYHADFSQAIARVGIQLHFHKMQRMFFKYEQSYLEGEIMDGKYEVLSRSYYDVGVEIIAIGTHEQKKAAITKVIRVNTPTDYVRFFDGNYLNILYKFVNAGRGPETIAPSLFWIGPVHSNGSIALGSYDCDYPLGDYGPDYNIATSVAYGMGRGINDATDLNMYSPTMFERNMRYWPNLAVNNTQYKYRPMWWGCWPLLSRTRISKAPLSQLPVIFLFPVTIPRKSLTLTGT